MLHPYNNNALGGGGGGAFWQNLNGYTIFCFWLYSATFSVLFDTNFECRFVFVQTASGRRCSSLSHPQKWSVMRAASGVSSSGWRNGRPWYSVKHGCQVKTDFETIWSITIWILGWGVGWIVLSFNYTSIYIYWVHQAMMGVGVISGSKSEEFILVFGYDEMACISESLKLLIAFM